MLDFIREKVCFYSSVLNGQNSTWSIVKSAVQHGVAGVELMNFSEDFKTPDMKLAKEIGAYAKSNGLKLPCFSCGVNFMTEQAKNLERIKRYADICSELEIPYLHHTLILTLKSDALCGSVSSLMDTAVECALEINDYAAKIGVSTLVEDQGFIVNGVERYGEFRRRTEGKIGVLLDFGNIMFVDEKAEDFYAAYDDVKQIHVKDYKLSVEPLNAHSYKTAKGSYLSACNFGEGDVNMERLAEMLKEKEYSGYYSLEFDPFDNDQQVTNTLKEIEKVFA